MNSGVLYGVLYTDRPQVGVQGAVMQDSQDYSRFTLKDVEQWAGADLAFRARSYVRKVDDLRIGADGQLLGWVEGSSRYVTRLELDAAGHLQSTCTCGGPRNPCKHAVALLMAAMFRLQDGATLSPAAADDIRLGSAGVSFLPIEKIPGGGSHGQASAGLPDRLVQHLTTLNKGQLVDLLVGLAEESDEVTALIAIRFNPEDDKPADQVAWLSDALIAVAERPGWKDPRSGEQFTPDYGPVERGLVALAERGGAAEVVKLGVELSQLANQQLAETEDDGETQAAIIECLAVVLAALERSPLDPVARVCWYWDRLLDDPYHLYDGLDQPQEIEQLQAEHWRQVAASRRGRLQTLPGREAGEDWHLRNLRGGLLEQATAALQRAGEREAATALLISELPYTGNFLALVDHLLGEQQPQQARDWAARGFAAHIGTNPAAAWRLVDRLAAMLAAEGDSDAVAALRVEQFMHHPTLAAYKSLRSDSEASHWPALRAALLHWLASGEHPAGGDDWPLPDSGLDSSADPLRVPPPCPHHALLIELALDEDDHAAVVHWYQQAPAHANHAERVAERVRDSHPQLSLAIWSARIESLIQEARTADYARARPYLEGVRDLYHQLDREADADAFFAKLRRRHKAKRRLLEVVDRVQAGDQRLAG